MRGSQAGMPESELAEGDDEREAAAEAEAEAGAGDLRVEWVGARTR